MDAPNVDVPDGFSPHFRKSGLTDPWEPLFSKKTDEKVVIGLRARDAHCNSRGMVHGGLIAALADNAMGLSCAVQIGKGLVTVNLTTDYMGAAKLGQWIEFDTDYTKTGRSICFAQCFITADDATIARANATFKVTD
ncbi:MAG: PaaI family thioesterase [Pseudomonadota bacterium]